MLLAPESATEWRSLAAACSIYKAVFFLLQFTREFVSVLQLSHMHVSECAMKLKVRMINSLSPQYQAIPENDITHLLPMALLLVLHTHNNTDGNKLMIPVLSDTAWYNYIGLSRAHLL